MYVCGWGYFGLNVLQLTPDSHHALGKSPNTGLCFVPFDHAPNQKHDSLM